MRSIRQTFLSCCVGTAPTPAHSYAHAYAVTPTLLLNLSQNLSILEKEVFLQKKTPINISNPLSETKIIRREDQRTCSPTLIALSPQPGSKTLSPALTDVGTTRPSLSGAPGPTVSDGDHSRFRERTGRSRSREEYSRCRFLNSFICLNRGRKEEKHTVSSLKRWTRSRSELQERHEGSDRLERSLGSRSHFILNPKSTRSVIGSQRIKSCIP
jgi:hypothetical protein